MNTISWRVVFPTAIDVETKILVASASTTAAAGALAGYVAVAAEYRPVATRLKGNRRGLPAPGADYRSALR